MIEQKVINKNGKIFTKIKTSKKIKSSAEQFNLSLLLRNYKCIEKWHSRQYRYYLLEGNVLK